MNYTGNEQIAIGFDNDVVNAFPIIRVSEANGNTKEIRGVSGVHSLEVWYISSFGREKIAAMPWPGEELVSDVEIRFMRESGAGMVHIVSIGETCAFMLPEQETSSFEMSLAPRSDVVDRDRVHQLLNEDQDVEIYPDDLAAEIEKKVLGQSEAVRICSEILTGNLRRQKTHEVTVIALFGPTGCGKTEFGKSLPEALKKFTGREYGFSQVSMNQFKESHTIQQFFGAPPSYTGYGAPTIFEPCRQNSRHVFLLDEIEKAASNILVGLMECFSNSSVKLGDNSVIDLSQAIFILTSNIPIDMNAYNAATNDWEKDVLCKNTFTKECCPGHPEVAGRINCLAFQRLSGDPVMDVILKFITEELWEYDMTLGGVDPDLMAQLIRLNSSSEYGARALKSAVKTALRSTLYDRKLAKMTSERKAWLSGDAKDIRISFAS